MEKRPVAEIGIVHFKKLCSDGGGGSDDNINRAKTQAKQCPVDLGKAEESLVRLRADLRKIAQNRSSPRARR